MHMHKLQLSCPEIKLERPLNTAYEKPCQRNQVMAVQQECQACSGCYISASLQTKAEVVHATPFIRSEGNSGGLVCHAAELTSSVRHLGKQVVSGVPDGAN